MIALLVLAGAGLIGWRYTRTVREQDPAPAASPPEPARSSAAKADAQQALEEEAELERSVRRSLLLLAGTTAGALISPVFTIVTVPFLVVQSLPLFRQGYQELREGKVGGAVVRMLMAGGMLVTRDFWELSLSDALDGYIDRLQLRAWRLSQRRLASVFGELPRTAWVRRGEVDIEVALADLVVGELVVVRAGQTIPVDGRIESGEASIEEQRLTGEARPADKTVGDSVLAATVVRSGGITVRVEQTGAATVVASRAEILNRTTDYTAALERKGAVMAERSVAPTLMLAALTQAWLGSEAFIAMLAVYPDEEALRLLGPISVLNYVRHAAEQRILIKDGQVLEALLAIDTVVFDGAMLLNGKLPGVASGEAALLVKELQARGLAVYILSADPHQETERLALQLGVDQVVAAARPTQRAERILAWREEGKRVCFVGDGLNDSNTLRAAEVSVSLTGTITTAHVVLLDGNLWRVPLLFDLAKDLAINLRHNLTALLAPSPLVAAGIFLLGFRTWTALLLPPIGALAATTNAMLAAERRLLKLQARPPQSLPAAPPTAQRDAVAPS